VVRDIAAYWTDPELICSHSESRKHTYDYAALHRPARVESRTEALKLARDWAHARAEDVVQFAAYSRADPPTVRFARDGRTEAVLYFVRMRGRLAVGRERRCTERGVAAAGLPDPYVEVEPFVMPTPDHGPPGTFVSVEGDGFIDDHWQGLNRLADPAYQPFYFGVTTTITEGTNAGCNLIVDNEFVRAHVTPAGHLTAAFRVGRTGSCFQERPHGRTIEIPTGKYDIHLRCHACTVGKFVVTDRNE
jgi:hypothetical protein